MPHLELVSVSSSIQNDLSFGRWLTGKGKEVKASGALTIVSAVATPLYLIAGATRLSPALSALFPYYPQWILVAACGIQFVVILILIVWTTFIETRKFKNPDGASDEEATARDECGYGSKDEWVKAKSDAQSALNQYRNSWKGLLVCLLMLYALLIFMYLPGTADYKLVTYVLAILITFANNCVALAFLFCYFALDQPDALGTRGQQNGKHKYWALWAAVLIVLTVVQAACMTLAFRHNGADGFTPENVSRVFGYISGAGVSVAMGFYVSRLKFLACPTWVLLLLYFYLAIQPLFAVFGAGNLWGTVIITNIALLLKGLLGVYMMFLFEQGRLLHYFMRLRRLNEIVGAEMRHFALTLEG
jgi:hypothetical protein